MSTVASTIKAIFRPDDGPRLAVQEGVKASRCDVVDASNRLESTIADLLAENDRLTGRNRGKPKHVH